jgi:hypothetical protein
MELQLGLKKVKMMALLKALQMELQSVLERGYMWGTMLGFESDIGMA